MRLRSALALLALLAPPVLGQVNPIAPETTEAQLNLLVVELEARHYDRITVGEYDHDEVNRQAIVAAMAEERRLGAAPGGFQESANRVMGAAERSGLAREMVETIPRFALGAVPLDVLESAYERLLGEAMDTPSAGEVLATRRRQAATAFLVQYPQDLKEHYLGTHTKGLDVGDKGWTGNELRFVNRDLAPGEQARAGWVYLNWKALGFNGVHFRGRGVGQTTIDAPTGNASISIEAGDPPAGRPATGIVKFSGVTMGPAGSKVIHTGTNTANRPDLFPLTLIVEDSEVLAPPGSGGRWGIFTDATDVLLRRVKGYAPGLSEHFSYAHGLGEHGITWEWVDVDGAAAELCKVTARPSSHHPLGPQLRPFGWYEDKAKFESAKHVRTEGYQPAGDPETGTTILIRNSTFTRWGLGWPSLGKKGKGGGVVIQGGQSDVQIIRCVFDQDNGNPNGLAIAFDDSGNEHYTRRKRADGVWEWVAGEAPANGNVLIQECVIIGEPGPSWLSPLVSVISLRGMGNTDDVVQRFRMLACAVYGENRTVTLNQVPVVEVAAINANPIPHYTQSLGYNTTGMPVLLHIQGQGLRDIAAGFVGAAP